jgi:hypothetical protein
MPDGSIYAGISPDTNRRMYVTAKDAGLNFFQKLFQNVLQRVFQQPLDSSLTTTFNKAQKYAKNLNAHGHKDWCLPTKAELNVLFENREKGALKGTFNLTGSECAGDYWSSTPNGDGHVWGQRFSDGNQWGRYYSNNDYGRYNICSVRCVR